MEVGLLPRDLPGLAQLREFATCPLRRPVGVDRQALLVVAVRRPLPRKWRGVPRFRLALKKMDKPEILKDRMDRHLPPTRKRFHRLLITLTNSRALITGDGLSDIE